MKSTFQLLVVGIVLTCASAHAVEKERSPQQNKMAMCNKEATGKTGGERKDFMKACLSAKKDAGGIQQQARLKVCSDEASKRKGDDRKAFIGECLKKS
ncbi:MAG: PsiF family protein [Burkholderiaceae bacterium]